VVVPDEVTSAAPPAPVPERTASGLVRRVRGAHVPVATAAAQPEPGPTPANENGQRPSTDPRAPQVDGAEFQRFLTRLVSGVQRSLDGRGPDDA
jgi:hypothetical protein